MAEQDAPRMPRKAAQRQAQATPTQRLGALVVLGQAADSDRPDCTRLYLRADESEWIDIPNRAIRDSEDVAEGEQTMPDEQRVWIDPEAHLVYGFVSSRKAEFLKGAIERAHAGRALKNEAGTAAVQQVMQPLTKLGWNSWICTQMPADCPSLIDGCPSALVQCDFGAAARAAAWRNIAPPVGVDCVPITKESVGIICTVPWIDCFDMGTRHVLCTEFGPDCVISGVDCSVPNILCGLNTVVDPECGSELSGMCGSGFVCYEKDFDWLPDARRAQLRQRLQRRGIGSNARRFR